MARSIYKWIVLFEDGSTETINASYLYEINEKLQGDDYSIISIVRVDCI